MIFSWRRCNLPDSTEVKRVIATCNFKNLIKCLTLETIPITDASQQNLLYPIHNFVLI